MNDTSEWPMFRRNPEHLGYIDEEAGSRGGVQWVFDTKSKPLRSSPAIKDGLVFIGSGNDIYALNSNPKNLDGEVVWKYSTSGKIFSSPAVAGNLVYITSMDGFIYALKQHPSNPPDGELAWRYRLGDFTRFTSSPTIYNDLLFVGSEVGYLYCLKAYPSYSEGELVWKYPMGGWMHGTPAVSDNKVFIGNSGPQLKQGYHIFCLNTKSSDQDGELLWKFKVGSKPWGIGTSPAVDSGRVFFSADDGYIYSLLSDSVSREGTLAWKYGPVGGMMSSVSVAKDRLFVGLEEGKSVISLDKTPDRPDGNLIWKYDVGSSIRSSPAIARNTLFIGTEREGKIIALDGFTDKKDGSRIWSYETYGPVFSSPAISEGKVFVASTSGHVYAFN